MSASKGSTCAGHAPKLNHDGLHANVLAQVVEEDQVHPEHQNVLLCRELRHHTVRSEYAKYTRTNTHSILPYLESRWVAVIGGNTDIARLDTEARAAGMLHNTNVAERANRRFFFNEHLLHPLIGKHCIGSSLAPSCVLSCLYAKQVTPHTLHRLSSQTRVTRLKSG